MDGELRRGSCFVFDMGDVWTMHGELLRPMLFVGCLVREWELQCRMLVRPWYGTVLVLWMEIGD